MKKKGEILSHLRTLGYQSDDVMKILGYLLGAKIIEKGEKVGFHKGDRTFEDFLKWLSGESRKNRFNDIAANLDYLLGFTCNKIPKDIEEKTRKNIRFLLDNCEYLQDCMDNKEKAEGFLKDIDEMMNGLNNTFKSIFANN